MIRINLLPHREEKRARLKQQFTVFCVAAALVGGLIGFVGYMIMQARIDNQNSRNRFLQTSITELEEKIKLIENIKAEIERLQRHKGVIENLQSTRGAIVHLFNALATDLPEGMFLSKVEQKGNTVTLSGYSQSNSRVSQLMEKLDASPYLSSPRVVEIKRALYKGRPVAQFALRITLVDKGTTGNQEANKK